MDIEIREYRSEDRDEWMRAHAIILSTSHAWNYTIQERPAYEGYASTRLVALCDGRIVGLVDVQYDNKPGELCLLNDSRGGYVLEFGRLPEFAGKRLGKQLIDAASERARGLGFGRFEFWTQDRTAQRYYQRMKFPEIGRHYRFRMRPPKGIEAVLKAEKVGIEYLYGACLPEEWTRVKEQYDIIEKHPLEPHLCIGYEFRFVSEDVS